MKKNKLYLVLNESINGIGGSYIYIMNKLNYYERNGYDVNVIHGGHAVFKTIIPKLKTIMQKITAYILFLGFSFACKYSASSSPSNS